MDERMVDTLPELGTKAAAVAGIESMLYAAIRLREPFSPLQLRYWLDAYYQARIAAAGWTEARTPTPPTWDEIRDVLHRQAGWEDGGPPRASAPTEETTPHQSPAATASPQGEAKREEDDGADVSAPPKQAAEDGGPPRASASTEEAEWAPQKYDVIKIRAEDLEEARPVMEIIRDEIRRAAKAAGIEIEDEAGPPRASAPTEETEHSAAPEDAAETQQTAEDAAETQQKTKGATSSVTAEAVTPSPQGEGRPRQRPVGWTDGFEPVEIKKGPAAEAAKFKREQFERLQRFLREGVTMQRIVKAAEGNITEDQILRIRECRRVPVAVYRVLEAALDRIETD